MLREFIDSKTSIITDEDPLRGWLFYKDLGFSHTLGARCHYTSLLATDLREQHLPL